jgi:hypothetical protein
VLGFHDPVDGDDRQTLGLQLAIAVVTGRQATGDNQRIAAARRNSCSNWRSLSGASSELAISN